MAIIETGLGWYADSAWLTDSPGSIGVLRYTGGSADFSNQPIPVSSSPTFLIGYRMNGQQWQLRSSSVAETYAFLYKLGGSYTWGVATPNAGGVVYSSWGGVYPGSETFSISTYDQQSGWYYYGRGVSNDGYVSDTVPSFDTLIDAVHAAAGYSQTTTYAKNTDGYSITCMCKWKVDVDGDVYVSPVLISSNQNSTIYTRNQSIPTVPVTEHQFQNMTFYMRKAPLDVFEEGASIESDFPVVDLSASPVNNDLIFALIASRSSLGVGYPQQPEDPYGPGGTSEPSDSDPTFDDTSDTIADSAAPSYSFASSGFSRIYNPDLTQLNRLANYLWTDQSFLQTVINHLKQLIEDPVDAVISVSMLPVPIPQGTSEEVKIMYIPTGVYMPPALTQYVDVNCGSLFIDEFYGSALDYNPYTKISLFLPFVGMVDLDTDEVMNKTIFVKYRVDIVSGSCVAKVFVGNTEDNSCLYQFTGDCAVSMPLNSADFSTYRAAFIQAIKAVAVATAGAAGGVAAGAAEGAIAAADTAGASAAGAAAGVNQSTSLVPSSGGGAIARPSYFEGLLKGPGSNAWSEKDVAEFMDGVSKGIKDAGNVVAGVMGGKMQIQHASGFSGNSGMLGIRRPYVVIKRPNMCNPEQYGKYNGRPCAMYLNLGTLSGYTEVQSVQLTGFTATNPELSEIARFLMGGVVL